MLFNVLVVLEKAAPLLLVCSIPIFIVLFTTKRGGFKRITHDLRDFGPVLLKNRGGSVTVNGWNGWQRTVTITLFRQHIHLKLAAYLGGLEQVIPLQGASYSFFLWRGRDVVKIQVDRKTYEFGGPIPTAVKQHYC